MVPTDPPPVTEQPTSRRRLGDARTHLTAATGHLLFGERKHDAIDEIDAAVRALFEARSAIVTAIVAERNR